MVKFRKSRTAKSLCAVLVGLAAVAASSSVSAQRIANLSYDNAQRVPVVQPSYVASGTPYTVSVYCLAGETIEFSFSRNGVPIDPSASQACTVPAGQSVGNAVATLTAPNIGSTPAIVGTLTTRVKNSAGEYTNQNYTNFIIYTDLVNNFYNGPASRSVTVSPSAETVTAGSSFTVSIQCFNSESVEFRFAGTTTTAKCPPTSPTVSATFVAPAGTYPLSGTVTLPGVATYQFSVGRATASTTTVGGGGSSSTIVNVATTLNPSNTIEPTLPVSGAPAQTIPIAVAALVLALTGVGLVAIGRRRNSTLS